MKAAPTQKLPPIVSRIAGLAADIVLLALFLVLGVALLNVLMQVIVLIVGIVRAASLPEGWPNPEPGRFGEDITMLGIAFVAAVVAFGLHWGFLRLRKKLLRYFVAAGFETFVSKRYLLAREGSRLVSLISVVSVLGVAVGVMALIVVLGVMQGFDQALTKKFMGVYSHLEVKTDYTRQSIDREIPKDVWQKLVEDLPKIKGVEAAAPLVTMKTVVQASTGAAEEKLPAMIRGVDPKQEKKVSEFSSYVTRGTDEPGFREVVIGKQMARRLRVGIGDKIYIIGRLVATANRTAPKTMPVKIVGVFDSGLYDVDEMFVYTDLQTVQELLMKDDVVTSVHAKLTDPNSAEEYQYKIMDVLPPGYGSITWKDLNPQFFEALMVERVAMFIILLLIVLVAALNIIGTLVMTVVQKTRDIGILKSMGSPRGAIMRIFLLHGFLIGLVGTSLGVVWGLWICRFVETDIDKIFMLPAGVYGLDRLPVVVDPLLISYYAGSALLICIVAALIPAWQASRLDPVEALRYD